MDLLDLCLTSTYFQYNSKHYKQLHGTAMGLPVSVVVVEIVLQHVEERALATCQQTIPPFTKTKLTLSTTTLTNRMQPERTSKEIKGNGKLPFLDSLVSCNNNELQMTVYRKPMHTDKLLNQSSYNLTSHKAMSIKTLTRQAQLVCDTPMTFNLAGE